MRQRKRSTADEVSKLVRSFSPSSPKRSLVRSSRVADRATRDTAKPLRIVEQVDDGVRLGR
jgi:hypothetical protein